jgi:phosphotriesterase-related protein
MVDTVRGPVEPAQLGFTLMHEHIAIQSVGVRQNWPELFDRAAVVGQCVAKLNAAKAAGVDSLVDLTTVDLGRDLPLFEEIAAQTELQLIVATGFHINVPRYFHLRPVEESTRLFVKDIQEGIQGTSVRAGVIKLACNDRVVAGPYDLSFRAGARAHRQTGVPISTHTDSSVRSGLDQQRILAEEGVELTRVVIGHSGDTDDLEYLERLLARGSYIGMDRFGLDQIGGQQFLDFAGRVRLVAELCQRGYANQLVLGHDASGYSDPRPNPLQERLWPNWHFSHISQDVLPALREAGVSEAQIEQMTTANPRALFSVQGGY